MSPEFPENSNWPLYWWIGLGIGIGGLWIALEGPAAEAKL